MRKLIINTGNELVLKGILEIVRTVEKPREYFIP